MAVTIVSIFVAMVIPSIVPGIEQQLSSGARIAASELNYARSLAITYNSKYKVTFDMVAHQLVIEHSGVNPTLDTLPSAPFRRPQDPADQHIVRLDSLPGFSEPIEIISAYVNSAPVQLTSNVEFSSFGQTIQANQTYVWLAAGAGNARVYIPLVIDPVTGMTTVGNMQETIPPLAGV